MTAERTESTEERDARLFLEDVFGAQPGGLIAITIAPKWGSPHCVKTPADALHYVVGRRDVYFRLGLVAHRPKKRGIEADTVAIPGVWAEVDLNGAPDGRGGTIVNAATDDRSGDGDRALRARTDADGPLRLRTARLLVIRRAVAARGRRAARRGQAACAGLAGATARQRRNESA